MTRTSGKTLAMRGIGVAAAIIALLGVAQGASAIPSPTPADHRTVTVVQQRLYLHGWTCANTAVAGPRAIVRTASQDVRVVRGKRVGPLMRAGTQLLYWCHQRHGGLAGWEPGDIDPPLGSEDNPMHVYASPNANEDGGSHAWADYGLYQILRANKPSAAAHTLCEIDAVGDSLWIEGGMLQPGRWNAVAVTVFNRLPSDVDILVTDPDGTHGGDCSPGGLVLRRVG